MTPQEAYVTAFIKRAQDYGMTEGQAVDLLKSAGKIEQKGESSLRRYFAQKALRSQMNLEEHPYRSQVGQLFSLPGLFGITAANPVETYLGQGDMSEEERAALADKALARLKDDDIVGRTIRKSMVLPALLGAPIGALYGGATGLVADGREGGLPGALIGALGGSAIGALGGGATGAIRGALDKAFLSSAKEQELEKAKKTLARSPYLTSLPGGDIATSAEV